MLSVSTQNHIAVCMITSRPVLKNIFSGYHVPWTYKMKSGSTLWRELCMKYNMGVAMVEVYRDFWHTSAKQYMKGHEQEWQHTDSLLNVQLENAKEWRNTCLKYFQTFSKMKIYE